MTQATEDPARIGQLALRCCGIESDVLVLKSAAGYYIGTVDEDRLPCSRESVEYFPTETQADSALATGRWTQRQQP